MSTCVRCARVKGKRRCPALGGLICPRCCGEGRLRTIACPAHCRYLEKHERYRHARAGEAFHARWLEAVAPLYVEQREGVIYLLQLELALYKYLKENPRLQDAQVHEALAALHRQLSPIHVVEATISPLARHLIEASEAYREENPRFDPEAAQAAVGALMALVPDRADREAVSGFMGHVETHADLEAFEDEPAADEIVVPRIITPEDARGHA